MELVGGGSVINGATPSSLLCCWCLNVECVILALISTNVVQFYQTNYIGKYFQTKHNGFDCDKAH